MNSSSLDLCDVFPSNHSEYACVLLFIVYILTCYNYFITLIYMGLQRKQREEIDDTQPVPEQETPPEPVQETLEPDVQEEPPKKVGRPKKEKKPRTAKQLANDERQRQRFKQQHEAKK